MQATLPEPSEIPAHPDQISDLNSAQPIEGPEPSSHDMPPPNPTNPEKKSLLVQAAAAKKGKPEETENERLIREEQELLRNITKHKALKGAAEIAKVSR